MHTSQSSRGLGLLACALLGTGVLTGCDLLQRPDPVTSAAGPAPGEQAAGTAGLADEMRMPWSREAGGYVRAWLVCGVFPNPPQTGKKVGRTTAHRVGAGYDTDYLAATGGEAGARPAAGQRVSRPDGTAAKWRAHVGERDELDFRRVFSGQKVEDVVAYAFTKIRRKVAGEGMLSLGSDDSVKVWLNGELVHDHRVGRGVQKDEDAVPVRFRAGDNAVLVKVENGGGGWGLVLRPLGASQAAVLAKGEIRPAIEPSPADQPDTLIVQTDTGPAGRTGRGEMVRVDAVAAGGEVASTAAAARGTSVRFNTTAWADGPYEIRVSRRTAAGHTSFHHLPWYKGEWRKQVRKLLDACEKLPALPADETSLRLAFLGKVVRDRMGGDPRTGGAVPDGAWRDVHSPLMEHREATGGEAGAIRPHGFLRLAWRDEVDDSPQYARAYLPADYNPAAGGPWPMVVLLHGYNPPNPEYVRWWGVTERHSRMAERHGVIVLEPHGRGNTSYNGIGDADVLRAVEAAKARFRVDDDRVYLMGYSMGGGGTWHVGTRHPGLFAAIGPVYGGWDYHQTMTEDELAALTPRRRFEAESRSSFCQAESLLTTPVFVNHGDDDTLVNVKYSRYAVRMLQRWGYAVRYWEHPGKGHERLGCEDELVRWFLTHRRTANPRRVRVRSARLETAAAHWVRVERRENPFAMIRAEARVLDPRTIRLDTDNALQVRLAPAAPLIDPAAPVRVVWNGRDAGAHALVGGAVTLRAVGYEPDPNRSHKTPAISGPIDDATTTPFLLVVGTIARDERMRRFCRLRAETARDEWRQWQKVAPRFALDTEATDEQLRAYSLILFGGPEENLVTKGLAEKLGLAVGPERVSLGGQSLPARGASYAMVGPHPYRRDRYVVVRGGTSPAGIYFSHELPGDLDFALADARFDPDAAFEDLCLAGGRFDKDWRFDEKYAFRGDTALRQSAAVRKAPTVLRAAAGGKVLALGDLVETRASGSFAFMRRDMSWRGGPIRLSGKAFEKGIAVQVWHERCAVTYDLAGGRWARLKATLGIEIGDPAKLADKQKDGTQVFFVVRGDGKELYRSPTFRWDSPSAEMDVDVRGVEKLELAVGNEATWHNAAESVNWASVRLER